MKLSRRICFFTLIFCVCVFSVSSQKKSEEKTSALPFDVEVNLLISDASDYFVENVKQEDIKIFEDGIEQKITSFKKRSPVLNLALVVDNTGSMRDKLNEITFASSIITSNLRPTDEAMIVRFVDSSKVENRQEWTSNQKDLRFAIENLYIEGGQSAVLDAVYLAQEEILKREKEDKSKRYAILLISDVEERNSYYKYDEVLKLFKDSDSQVFVLSYAENAPQEKKKAIALGHKIALETGGTIHNLAKKHSREDLAEILKKIVFELRSNYTITYTPTNQNRDGLTRKLTVEVKESEKAEKRNVRMRDGFTVPLEK